MHRKNVYEVIDGERAYQDHVWGLHGTQRQGCNPQDGVHSNDAGEQVPSHDAATWLMYMEYYLAKAREEFTTKQGVTAGLHMLRKAVALGIACFEQHGVPPRSGNDYPGGKPLPAGEDPLYGPPRG